MLTELRRIDPARRTLHRALRTLAAAGGEDLLEGDIRNNLAVVEIHRLDWARAGEQLDRAEALFAGTGMTGRTAMVWHNRAWAAGLRGDVPAALTAFDEAGRRYAAAGMATGLLVVERAEALLTAGLVAEAREAAAEAVAELEEQRNRVDLVHARVLLAEALLLDDDAAAAREVAARAGREAARQGIPGMGGPRRLRAAARAGGLGRPSGRARRRRAPRGGRARGRRVGDPVPRRPAPRRPDRRAGRPAGRGPRRPRRRPPGRPPRPRRRAGPRLARRGTAPTGGRRPRGHPVRRRRRTAGARRFPGRPRSHRPARPRRGARGPARRPRGGGGARVGAAGGGPRRGRVRPGGLALAASRPAPRRRRRSRPTSPSSAGSRPTAARAASSPGSGRARQAALERAVRDRARHAAGAAGQPHGPLDLGALHAALGDRVLVELVTSGGSVSAVVAAGGRLRLVPLAPEAEVAAAADALLGRAALARLRRRPVGGRRGRAGPPGRGPARRPPRRSGPAGGRRRPVPTPRPTGGPS